MEYFSTAEQRAAVDWSPVALDCRASDSEISGHALWSASTVKTLLARYRDELKGEVTTEQPGYPLRFALNDLARACQAQPVDDTKELAPTIARMVCGKWWRRNLRRALLRENESIEHAAGHIRKKTQCYVSDHAVHSKRQRAKANRATLEGLEVVNETGAAFNLAEVCDGSVSNPKIRRGELMMRCRGFEETAAFMGHVGLFLTLTCPSRFHRFGASGQPNKNWTDATPKDGQEYLSAVWAKIRAAWKRKGMTPYGFRVAEPHHDGCPHWHILLFTPGEYGAGLVAIAKRYALQDSPNESGALKHRFTCKEIDASQGTATGYIAKYICKNIDGAKEDGEGMGLDFASGTDAAAASERVRAWAATWGIRQFQQVGGPSVTVWRELRRLGAVDESLIGSTRDLFDAPRNAADRSLWSLFWILQGGPDTPRRQLTLKPLYVTDTVGAYGDTTPRILGVTGTEDGQEYAEVTRLHTWTVQVDGLSAVNALQADFNITRAFNRRESDFMAAYADIEFQRKSEALSTWTGVNNCTPDDQKPVFDFSQFDPETGEIPYLPVYNRTGDPGLQLEEVDLASWELKKTNAQHDYTN